MEVKLVKQNNQGYRINGLIFPSVVTFYILKIIDNNFCNIDKDELINFFSNAPKIILIEAYPDACEELEGLFLNAAECLMYENKKTSTYHKELYKAANKFFGMTEFVSC